MPSKQVYARQRLVAGLVVGAVAQLVVAFILGFVLIGGFSFGVRMFGTLVSSVVATPATWVAGFAFMLKDDARSFGVGLVVGSLLSTAVIALGYLIS